MAGTLSQEQREAVIARHKAGESRNAIARATGVSAGSVSGIIKDAGLTFDRSTVAAATEARVIDLAARRAQLEERLIDDAERYRARSWQPMEYRSAVGGMAPQVMRWELDLPTAGDQLKLAQACGVAVQTSLKIAQSRTDSGTADAKSMLTTLAAGLQAAYRDLQAADTKEEPTDG